LQVTVELKNDLAITGLLHSVDQYLNVKLTNTRVVNETKYPHMVGIEWDVQRLGSTWCNSCAIIFVAVASLPAEVCAELLHQRVCGALCAGE
jgi:small nuclear ribonucleoprotein (snRNP)-like protein